MQKERKKERKTIIVQYPLWHKCKNPQQNIGNRNKVDFFMISTPYFPVYPARQSAIMWENL